MKAIHLEDNLLQKEVDRLIGWLGRYKKQFFVANEEGGITHKSCGSRDLSIH